MIPEGEQRDGRDLTRYTALGWSRPQGCPVAGCSFTPHSLGHLPTTAPRPLPGWGAPAEDTPIASPTTVLHTPHLPVLYQQQSRFGNCGSLSEIRGAADEEVKIKPDTIRRRFMTHSVIVSVRKITKVKPTKTLSPITEAILDCAALNCKSLVWEVLLDNSQGTFTGISF